MPSSCSRPKVRQLAIVEHNRKVGTGNRHYSHLLVCSTAPLNAENSQLECLNDSGGTAAQFPDKTDSGLSALREQLRLFLQDCKARPVKASELKLNLVLKIHGYSTPLRAVLTNGYRISESSFQEALLTPPNRPESGGDFLLFIDYAWPSEAAFNLHLFGSLLGAIPIPLLGVASLLIILLVKGLLVNLSVAVLGLIFALLLLRLVAYFRDRDRAAGIGVFDVVELLRWMHVIFSNAIQEVYPPDEESPTEAPINVSILAHSMGAFVATQAVRTLSDVFDPRAIQRWKEIDSQDGPFALSNHTAVTVDPTLDKIGTLFHLKRLVLASPDIPIWALISSRSNPLLASLRRFEEVFLFTNDADMVLRLASTVANSFVIPSNSRKGGYRLGNLVALERAGVPKGGETAYGLDQVGLNGLGGGLSLGDPPFSTASLVGRLTLVDCTDYQDCEAGSNSLRVSRRLSALTARTQIGRLLNYLATTVRQFVPIPVIGGLDSHGGYFRGQFCLNLMHSLLLYGSSETRTRIFPNFTEELERTQIRWIHLEERTAITRPLSGSS